MVLGQLTWVVEIEKRCCSLGELIRDPIRDPPAPGATPMEI